MNAAFAFYPLLTDDLFRKIGLQVMEYEFSHESDNQVKALISKPLTGQEHILARLYLSDEAGEWDPDKHKLIFRRKLLISNPSHLFGENGIAPRNAEIGVAVKWTSKPSKQRGVFIGDSFVLSNRDAQIAIQGEFPPGILREHFNLTTILYLKAPGFPRMGEEHLASMPGVDLGELDSVTIFLSGDGSFFPVFTVNDSGPLWRLECFWDDPRIDSFDESSFKILLNENHPHYKYIFSANGREITPVMQEIFLSAMQLLIENVTDEVPYEDIMNGRDMDYGSISMAVKYFIETFELDIQPREKLAYSLRRKVEKNLGGIGQ